MDEEVRQRATQKEILISFDTLRKLLGALGIALPVVLIVGSLALHGCVLRSISAYYYTPLRDLLVAIFCSIGLFLFAYTGYKDPEVIISENMITNCAGGMAVLVALLPTSFLGYSLDMVCTSDHIPCLWNVVGVIDNLNSPATFQNKLLSISHLIAAIFFFAFVAYLSIFRFTKITDSLRHRRKEKRLYRACGYIIVGCIIIMILDSAANNIWGYNRVESILHSFPVLFTFESISLWHLASPGSQRAKSIST